MKRRSVIITLPSDWHEVEGARPRAYRRRGPSSGILQISLKPPLDDPISSGEQALARLDELLAELGPLGKQLASGHDECAAGFMAFALYKHDKNGLMAIWFIPGEVTVFATWQMGSTATAAIERSEAHEIMRQVRFEDSDPAEPFLDEPDA